MTPTTTPQTCYFLNLPAELRLMIYEEAFSAVDITIDGENLPKIATHPLVYTSKSILPDAEHAYIKRLEQIKIRASSGYHEARISFLAAQDIRPVTESVAAKVSVLHRELLTTSMEANTIGEVVEAERTKILRDIRHVS